MELLTEYQIPEVNEFYNVCESIKRYDIQALSEGDIILLEVDAKAKYQGAMKGVRAKVAAGITKLQTAYNTSKSFLMNAYRDTRDAAKRVDIKKKLAKAKETLKTKTAALKKWGADKIASLKTKLDNALFDLQKRGRAAKKAGAHMTKGQQGMKALKKAGKLAAKVA